MDWDNLRYFLELARTGTLAAAGRHLNVDHSTVARRIQALEKALAEPLFAREAAGHRLTERGRRLLVQAEAMERAFQTFAHSAAPLPPEALGGVVRVGATEGFGTVVLAPALARFAQQHPRLVVDLLTLPRQVHLSRREADIVIGLERPARGSVVAVKLCDYSLHLYAARSYLQAHPPLLRREALRGHPFISYVDDLLFSKELQFLGELHTPEAFALRSTSVLAQHRAVQTGCGVGVLPAFVAEADPLLQRVLTHEPQARFVRSFWMSMPGEAKSLPRVKAVWDFVRSTVQALQAQLLLPSPSPSPSLNLHLPRGLPHNERPQQGWALTGAARSPTFLLSCVFAMPPALSALPVLYSFRRCPFAMRARWALNVAGVALEHREILLRDKPLAMLQASAKGTVPVLVLPDGQVIDESLDIMCWALAQHDPENWLRPTLGDEPAMLTLIASCQRDFKPHLDRSKYPQRYEAEWLPQSPSPEAASPAQSPEAAALALSHYVEAQHAQARQFLRQLAQPLLSAPWLFGAHPTLADFAIAPFVRQYARADEARWASSLQAPPWARLHEWLETLLARPEFDAQVMHKHPVWVAPPAEASD